MPAPVGRRCVAILRHVLCLHLTNAPSRIGGSLLFDRARSKEALRLPHLILVSAMAGVQRNLRCLGFALQVVAHYAHALYRLPLHSWLERRNLYLLRGAQAVGWPRARSCRYHCACSHVLVHQGYVTEGGSRFVSQGGNEETVVLFHGAARKLVCMAGGARFVPLERC